MRLLITGGTGVLGRALLPLAEDAGHETFAPGHRDLDLFNRAAVDVAARDTDAVVHLATRIQPLDKLNDLLAWRENDRLRAQATAVLVDAALAAGTGVFVMPTVTFVYPSGEPVDEDTPLAHTNGTLASALVAEEHTARFSRGGRRGVVLRLGLLDGPGTGHDEPVRSLGATLHVDDAATALLAALTLPAGVYNACRDGEDVSNARLSAAAGWRPKH
jgi:nucleoside-diphosphate-sugar epimerase